MATDPVKLREAVWSSHKRAESSEFSGLLISGRVSIEQWKRYVSTQFLCVAAIESKLPKMDAIGISRRDFYGKDCLDSGVGKPAKSVSKYVDRISGLDDENLIAHVYVRYLGDLYGGSLISKNIKWPCSHLFFTDKERSIDEIRKMIVESKVDLIPEAILCFKEIKEMYDELV